MKAFLRLAAALLVLAATGARAGGPMTVCNDDPKTPIAYAPATVNLNYDLGNLGSRTKAQADAIVTSAVALWTNVGTATISIGRGSDLPVDVTTANYLTYIGGSTFGDGLNPVVYDTNGSITDLLLGVGAKNSVLGFAGSAYFLAPTCQYAEGRAVINGFISVSDTTMSVVLAHEIGHLIGLDHTQLDSVQGLFPSNYPLMYPIAYRATASLHDDDIAAVSALYPDATLNSVYGQISGTFVLADGVTPVRGANLWATETTTGQVYSVVSDYLTQNTGFFKLLLPAGTYNLRAEAISTSFTGGSSVGPYSETTADASFQAPLYAGSTPMATLTLGNGTPTAFSINPGCAATLTFRFDGTGTVGGDCNSISMATTAQSVSEAAGSVDVIVNRVGSAAGVGQVNYTTVDGSAVAGTHYTLTSGTLNWADGDGAPKTITVPIIDNGAVNPAHTFNVNLSGAIGVTLGSPVSTAVTITDDENTLQLAFANAAIVEGNPTLTVPVTRTGGTAAAASVDWSTVDGTALAGSDFGTLGNSTPVSGTLNWAAGDSATKNINVPILNDAIFEPTKNFSIELSNATGTAASLGAPASVAVTLMDDEAALDLSSPTYSVNESGPNISVTVNRSGAATSAISVTWTTANGTAVAGQDYGTNGNGAQRTGTLSWAAGDTAPKTFTVGTTGTMPILNDGVVEGDEDFSIVLSNPTNGAVIGATGTATVTIVDNDSTIAFSPNTLTVSEAGPNGTLTVTRTGSALTAASVHWATTNGTAFAGSDFGTQSSTVQRSGTISWAAGDSAPKTIAVGPTAVGGAYIPVLNDALIEGPETFTVTLSAPSIGGVLGAAAATVTIDSNDSAVTMASSTKSVAESVGTASVLVNRTGSGSGAISVNYATANGTALAGTHYTTTTGTLNWADGDTAAKTISVPIIDNTAVNTARTFNVNLSAAVGAILAAPATTTVTIADDDNTLQFSAAAASVSEATANLTLSVTRLGGTAGTASITWSTADGTALAGTDFGALGNATPVSGTLNWAAADAAAKTITIPILNDALVEPTKTFTVNLSGPVGTGVSIGTIGTVTVTLLDDEAALNFSSPTYNVTESGPNLTVTVNRSGAATSAVSVTWTTANGTAVAGQDYGSLGNVAQRTGTLSWLAGDSAPKSFTVGPSAAILPIINDNAIEGNETFTIALSSPTGGGVLGPTSTATITIVDNESTIAFSPTTLTVSEGGPNGALTVTRTGSTATAASVNWTTSNGTALAGSDFGTSGSTLQKSGTISWAAGDSAPKTINVGPTAAAVPYIPVLNDALIEGPETFTVTLSAPSVGGILGANSATVTIASDDRGVTMTSATQSVAESVGTAVVSVNRSGSSTGAVSVNFTTVNGTALAGTHYTTTTGTLNWADGDTAPKTINVPIIDNTAVNAARTFNVTLSGAVGATLGAPATTTVTIADDDNTLQFSAAAASVSEATANLTLSVTRLGGAAGAASVNWSTADGTALAGSDFGALGNTTPVSGTLNWVAGDAAAKTITIPILNNAIVESAETFTVNLSGAAGTGASIGAIGTVTVTVIDDEASLNFSSPTYSVNEAGPNATITVTRSGAATSAISVTWTTANGTAVAGQDYGTLGNVAQRTGTLSWLAGDTAPKTFTIGPSAAIMPIINDTAVEADETFTIALSGPTGGAVLGPTGTATVTIVDNDSTIAFAPTTLSVNETGPNGVLTVTRTGSAATAASVTWRTSNGTALAGSDFGTSGSTLQKAGTVSWAAGDSAPKTIAVGPTAVGGAFIPVLNDAVIEGPETFTVTLSAPTGGGVLGVGATAATVTIASDDRGVTMTSATQSVAESVGTAVVSVNRSGSSTGAVSVNYATVNGTALAGTHYTATSGTLNWADGDAAPKTINVPIADNGVVNPARTFNVTLSGAVGATLGAPATTTVTIADDDNTLQFSAATATVAEGTANITLTVTRLGGTAGTASVGWATADGTALAGSDFGTLGNTTPLSGTLNWAAADALSKTITIPILNDAIVEGAKTFTVNLSGPVGTGTGIGTNATATVTINDNDAGVVFSNASYSVNESGGSITITANRIGPATLAATVTWTTANATANAGSDFGTLGSPAQRSGMLSWLAGNATPKTIVIPILNDAVAEGNETFTVAFSSPSAGIVLGTPSSATVTIVDDETPPESTLQFSAPKTTVTETLGTVDLTVTRRGSGYTFPGSVNYTTMAGTALATSDYTTRSGTLTWASGDSTPRTITVPITGGAVAESPEQFTVQLSAPTPGMALGTPSTATVLILDDDELFPPLGNMPAGWTMPVAANAAWHVNNDPGAFEGVFALRSDTAFDNEVAQVEVAGTYLAGTLNFRLRISSELGFDFLRFYVDGVKAGEWSGTANTAWQLFSIPVAAGAHTFSWSYEKDSSGSVGQDAAWIDAVTLPAAGP